MVRKVCRVFTVAFAAVGLLGTIVVTMPVAEYLAGPLRLEPELRPAEAIVVLGGGAFRDDVPSLSSLPRAVYGYTLYRARYAPRLFLSGGRVRPEDGWEALSMKRLLQGIGAPPAVLQMEERSTRTYGNAVESARILRSQGADRILLVTHPNHMWRAKRTFEKAGFTVYPAPIPWDRLYREKRIFIGRIGLFYDVLYEYAAIALYWWRGWL
jgi:uncharacterized SAM-binding protein YcdF (DUF218 family)